MAYSRAVTTATTSPTVPLARTAAGDVVPEAARRARSRAGGSRWIDWGGSLAITALAAFLRLWDLGAPKAFLFDETYYAKDAWSLVHHGYVTGYVDKADDKILAGQLHGLWTSDPSMIVHPEVGKWLIGWTEQLVGMTPFGWRLAPAVVGSLMVLVMIRLARRVTRSTLLGWTAGILMCFDGLQLVLSRLALLDIFVAFFTLLAMSCLLADRDWVRSRLADAADAAGTIAGTGPRLWWRPWLIASGLWWGLALGSKWSAAFPLAAFGVMVWLWTLSGRRSFGVPIAPLRTVALTARWLRGHRPPLTGRTMIAIKAAALDALPIAGYLVLIPLIVYVATWTGWLMHSGTYEQHLSNTQYGYWGSYVDHPAHGFWPELVRPFRSLYHYHLSVLDFHTNGLLDATHPYQSNPEGWLILNRPVGVDAQLNIAAGTQGCDATGGETCLRQVLLLGTPMLWWFGTAALVWSVLAWIGKRDWRYGVVVIGVAVTWLPWLRWDDRPIFSYYAILIEPFLILGAVLLLGEMLGRRDALPTRRAVGAIAAGTVVLAVVVNFGWFWPIYTDGLLTQSEWLRRIWFRSWI